MAARILRTAGFDAVHVARVLREIYGVEVELGKVEEWFNTLPEEVSKRPVLRRFVQPLMRDRLWALRYLAGAMLGDGDRYGELKVRDLSFARAYANALAIIINDPSAAIVREGRDGYHTRCCRSLAHYIMGGLWKVLAFLDRLDEKKHLLSGLLDADGAISPQIDGRYKSLYMFQIMFTNTRVELVELVKTALEDLGFNPLVRVMRGRHSVINGKVAMRKKPLYAVYVSANISKIVILARCINLFCERKRKLLEFFLATKDLSPRQRYELFMCCWRKINNKWWPVQDVAELIEKYTEPVVKRRERKHLRERACAVTPANAPVKCPKCKQPGTLTLQGDTGAMLICVIHDNGSCVLDSMKTDGKSIVCIKCGKPGRLTLGVTSMVHYGRRYWYARVRVEHYLSKGVWKWCHIMQMPLLVELTRLSQSQPQPPRTKQ